VELVTFHSTMRYVEHLTVTSDLANVREVQTWFTSIPHQRDPEFAWVDEQIMPLCLALIEGFTNTVRHAHAHLPPETPIEIDVSFCPDRIEIRIWDHGFPYEIGKIQAPDPDTYPEGGFGWSIIEKITDQLSYERFDDRNCLFLMKKQPG